jgi:CO/xanthine dehydrogenase Mo-binding subunit
MANYVGKSVARVDAHDKVTGSAVYSVDVDLPGMLFGATLRSPFAHARIIKIETSEAIKVPGVIAVVTGRDSLSFSARESRISRSLLSTESAM